MWLNRAASLHFQNIVRISSAAFFLCLIPYHSDDKRGHPITWKNWHTIKIFNSLNRPILNAIIPNINSRKSLRFMNSCLCLDRLNNSETKTRNKFMLHQSKAATLSMFLFCWRSISKQSEIWNDFFFKIKFSEKKNKQIRLTLFIPISHDQQPSQLDPAKLEYFSLQ